MHIPSNVQPKPIKVGILVYIQCIPKIGQRDLYIDHPEVPYNPEIRSWLLSPYIVFPF